jgi:uncharacterized membrane protein
MGWLYRLMRRDLIARSTSDLIAILVLSLLFAAIFALGGAGIYGSPFGSGLTMDALTILVGPLACVTALAVHKRSPRSASIAVVVGAIAGACLGLATPFRYVWEWVFLVMVWLPMVLAAVVIWVRGLKHEGALPGPSQ